MSAQASSRWRKLNTVRTTYLSTDPAGVWKLIRCDGGWNVFRAGGEGGEYRIVRFADTLAQAKTWTEDWTEDTGADRET